MSLQLCIILQDYHIVLGSTCSNEAIIFLFFFEIFMSQIEVNLDHRQHHLEQIITHTVFGHFEMICIISNWLNNCVLSSLITKLCCYYYNKSIHPLCPCTYTVNIISFVLSNVSTAYLMVNFICFSFFCVLEWHHTSSCGIKARKCQHGPTAAGERSSNRCQN